QSLTLHSVEVENAVSDRNSHPRLGACIAPPKNSERQILNGKIRTGNVGGFNPTLRFRIVSFVENTFHSRSFMNPAPEGRSSLAQRFSVCVRTGVLAIGWNEESRECSPGGASELSPALQRWEKWNN